MAADFQLLISPEVAGVLAVGIAVVSLSVAAHAPNQLLVKLGLRLLRVCYVVVQRDRVAVSFKVVLKHLGKGVVLVTDKQDVVGFSVAGYFDFAGVYLLYGLRLHRGSPAL